jgi:F-type H+-transporting ATPase subunit epsilon
MHVEIITPDKAAFSGEASSVILPGVNGYFEILDGHAPLVGLLMSGEVRIKTKDQPEVLLGIGSGVVEVTKNKVSLLADSLT